jgi:uncharacterized protein
MSDLRPALAAGYGCLVAWSELLDDINVFPVADGDTGANLRISLAPLRNPEVDRKSLGERLMRAATGNSGNIAAPFFQEFCLADTMADLAPRAASGSMLARRALVQPREGTMLTLFDRLAQWPLPMPIPVSLIQARSLTNYARRCRPPRLFCRN